MIFENLCLCVLSSIRHQIIAKEINEGENPLNIKKNHNDEFYHHILIRHVHAYLPRYFRCPSAKTTTICHSPWNVSCLYVVHDSMVRTDTYVEKRNPNHPANVLMK